MNPLSAEGIIRPRFMTPVAQVVRDVMRQQQPALYPAGINIVDVDDVGWVAITLSISSVVVIVTIQLVCCWVYKVFKVDTVRPDLTADTLLVRHWYKCS